MTFPSARRPSSSSSSSSSSPWSPSSPKEDERNLVCTPTQRTILTNHYPATCCVYPIRDWRFRYPRGRERRPSALFAAVAAARRARTHTHTHTRDGTRFAHDGHVVASDGWDDDDDDRDAREWVRAFGVPNARGCGVGAARACAAPCERYSRARERE